MSDNTTFTNIVSSRAFDYALAAFDRKHFFIANFVWSLPKGTKWLGHSSLARGLFDNWTLSGVSNVASGNPAELGLALTGQDAGNRLTGAYSAGNLSGQSPRLFVTCDPQGAANEINVTCFSVPGIGNKGPYPRSYLRNPGFQEPGSGAIQELPIWQETANTRCSCGLRLSMFSITLSSPALTGRRTS